LLAAWRRDRCGMTGHRCSSVPQISFSRGT
jgi:hypothetical protein